jgi:hypothetical protein
MQWILTVPPAVAASRRACGWSHGDVFIASGRENSAALESVEVHSVATGLWHTAGSMTLAREAVSVTLLQDTRVLIPGEQTP